MLKTPGHREACRAWGAAGRANSGSAHPSPWWTPAGGCEGGEGCIAEKTLSPWDGGEGCEEQGVAPGRLGRGFRAQERPRTRTSWEGGSP